ncbi:MAG TPA: glycerol-3-phosphate 1-O-acyltransferase PlsY [Xanthomonadales bacterium]|nr:glycerol-3-phosphate 1-O-acyltransferase PlsY [Xanthomonadales bacterium]
MIDLLAKALLAYLLGSVSGSMVMGAFRHVDIRQSGSGNAGGTNAFRTQGFWFALGVVVIDVGKGALAAWWFPSLDLGLAADASLQAYLPLACGFAAVVGHCYPLWYGFRGGKGAATAVGALLVIEPMVILPMLLTWLVVLTLTGWVGLGTMLAAISLVPAFLLLGAPAATVLFGVLLAAFIVLMHRSNIRNMLNGSEYRFERARIKNWFGRG